MTMPELTVLLLLIRDVSGVELLMNDHQNIKAEIDTRDQNFTDLFELGKGMLFNNHYESDLVRIALNT